MTTSLRLIPIAVLILVTLGADQVQAEAVCSDTLTAGQWIECTEDATSMSHIDIDLSSGVNITTTGESDHGILGHHQGAGDITINVNGTEDNKTITTSGSRANGISALSDGKGSIDLTITNVDITTAHSTVNIAHGISARQYFLDDTLAPYGTYNVEIRVSDSQITTAGRNNAGISGYHDGDISLGSAINTGNLEITVDNTDIMTTGDFGFGITGHAERTEGDVIITVTGGVTTTAGSRARGINGIHGSSTGTGESGDVVIHATNADIRTTYDGSVGTDPPIGLLAFNQTDGEGNVMVTLTDTNISTGGPGADAVFAQRLRGNGDVTITIQRGQITTNHYQAEGILGWHGGSEGATGDVRINLKDVTIETNGEQLVPSQSYTLSHGAFGYHTGDGDIIIDARSGTAISTNGAFSYGLRAFSAGTGNIQVTTHKGSSITNTGLSGHGIDARNTKADVMDDTRSITITVGGDITASGENAHGVRIGTGSSGFVGLDEDGYRRQTVTVNGRVTGGSGSGAGIYLSNGGKVIIGPQGKRRCGVGDRDSRYRGCRICCRWRSDY